MRLFKGKKAGWNCNDNEDGSTTCRRFEQDDKNQKTSTGTDITIAVDPNTCQPYFTGNTSIMDDDEQKIDSIVKKKIRTCKGGL